MARKRSAERLIVKARWEIDKRCIRGVRVSEGRDRGHQRISEGVQDRVTSGLADQFGLETIHAYQEIGVSGDAERADLEDAIQRIERHEAAWLVVSEVDRLGRDVRDIHETFHRIHRAGGCVLVHEPLVNSADETSQIILALLAQLAQQQRMKIARKWSTAQDEAWQRGVYPGDLPCGLRNPGPGEIPERPGHPMPQHVPAEVAAIRAVATALIEDGISWPLAARMMGDLLGRSWSTKGVMSLFARPLLKGELSFGDRPIIRDACEPILSASEFEAINGRRTTSTTARANKPGHLGAGTLRCSGCRHTLHHRTSGVGTRTYYCRFEQCPDPVRNLPAEGVEALLVHVAHEAHRAELETIMLAAEESGARTVQDVDGDLAAARTRKRQFALLLAQDPEDEDMREGMGTIKAQIADLEAERRAMENLVGNRAAYELPDLWASLETWERIEMVQAVLDVVFVDPGTHQAHPFAHGTYPHELPRKGVSVALASFTAADVPGEVRVPAARGA